MKTTEIETYRGDPRHWTPHDAHEIMVDDTS